MYSLHETLPSMLAGMEQAATTRPSKNAFIRENLKMCNQRNIFKAAL